MSVLIGCATCPRISTMGIDSHWMLQGPAPCCGLKVCHSWYISFAKPSVSRSRSVDLRDRATASRSFLFVRTNASRSWAERRARDTAHRSPMNLPGRFQRGLTLPTVTSWIMSRLSLEFLVRPVNAARSRRLLRGVALRSESGRA